MPYRILSLDGGGTWALIQVLALQEIYGKSATGHEVLKHFNLVAANSGGALTLGGLIKNLTLDQILNGYFLDQAEREKIFVKASFFQDPLNKTLHALIGVGAKYHADAKLTGLREIIGGDWDVRLDVLPGKMNRAGSLDFLVCTFDFQARRARYFRSNLRSRAASVHSTPLTATLAEAIHASTNAPVNYFDGPAKVEGGLYWDGGVAGLNNPVLAAVVDAMANGVRREDIQVLSIGTGTTGYLPVARNQPGEDHRVMQAAAHSSLAHDVQELATSILDDPPDAASFEAHVALGQPVLWQEGAPPVSGSLVRMNPLVLPRWDAQVERWISPNGFDSKTFENLVNLDFDAVEKDEVALIQKFAQGWIAGDFPNQPIRIGLDPPPYTCEIGQWTFADAKDAWLRICRGG